jgi:hypothetical protein
MIKSIIDRQPFLFAAPDIKLNKPAFLGPTDLGQHATPGAK